jgi:hypothetical protein
MIEQLIRSLSEFEGIEGIVLGGSRGIGLGNDHSDYDIAIYHPGKRIQDDILVKLFPKSVKIESSQVLISGRLGELKFELFQKNLVKIEQEITNNVEGKFKWQLSPLLPFGDLSYRIVSHLTNSKILFDRNKRLLKNTKRITPIPPLLKKSIINYFFTQLR